MLEYFNYFFIYWASIGGKYSRDISLDYSTEDTEDITQPKIQKLSFSINLPIDFNKWLLGANYINSVQRVLESYLVPNLESHDLTTGNFRAII